MKEPPSKEAIHLSITVLVGVFVVWDTFPREWTPEGVKAFFYGVALVASLLSVNYYLRSNRFLRDLDTENSRQVMLARFALLARSMALLEENARLRSRLKELGEPEPAEEG